MAVLSLGKNVGTHYIGGWVGCRASLDIFGKREVSSSARIQSLDCSACSVVIISITLWQLPWWLPICEQFIHWRFFVERGDRCKIFAAGNQVKRRENLRVTMLLGEIMQWSEVHRHTEVGMITVLIMQLRLVLPVCLVLCCAMCCTFYSHFEAAINCYLVFFFLLYEDFKSPETLKTKNVKIFVCALPVCFNPFCWCPAVLQLKLYWAAHYISPHLEIMLFQRQE